jgi:hypothetical protein
MGTPNGRLWGILITPPIVSLGNMIALQPSRLGNPNYPHAPKSGN